MSAPRPPARRDALRLARRDGPPGRARQRAEQRRVGRAERGALAEAQGQVLRGLAGHTPRICARGLAVD